MKINPVRKRQRRGKNVEPKERACVRGSLGASSTKIAFAACRVPNLLFKCPVILLAAFFSFEKSNDGK